MSEWIDIKDKTPKSGQNVRIKTYDSNGNDIEIDALFTLYNIDEYTEAWGWNIGTIKGVTARPTHWKLLPNPPEKI